MNIVLKKPDGAEYYIACIRRENGHYVTQGKCVRPVGTLRERGRAFEFESLVDARRKCRRLAKAKMRRRRYVQIQAEQLPESVLRFLEMPPDTQMSPEEMIQFLKETRRERYVVFADVSGLDDYFDAGVEYMGRITRDKDTLLVYDRFGEPRNVSKSRLSAVEPTERCMELKVMRCRNRETRQ